MESTLKFVWGLGGVFWDFTVAFHPCSTLEYAKNDDAKKRKVVRVDSITAVFSKFLFSDGLTPKLMLYMSTIWIP